MTKEAAVGDGFPDDPIMQTAVRRVRRETNRDDLLAASDGGTSATDVGAMVERLRVVARAVLRWYDEDGSNDSYFALIAIAKRIELSDLGDT